MCNAKQEANLINYFIIPRTWKAMEKQHKCALLPLSYNFIVLVQPWNKIFYWSSIHALDRLIANLATGNQVEMLIMLDVLSWNWVLIYKQKQRKRTQPLAYQTSDLAFSQEAQPPLPCVLLAPLLWQSASNNIISYAIRTLNTGLLVFN